MRKTGGARAAQSRIGKTLVMRNQQNNKRMRGRNRKSHNPLTRVYESNGPDVKIRGTASHIAEKYLQLARDAQSSSGDPVSAENYLQHAEHYFRLIAAAQEQYRQTTPFLRGDGIDGIDDVGDDGDDEQAALPGGGDQPVFGPRDPQPYLPRDAQFFPPRDQPSFGGRRAAAKDKDDDSNVERLPSFITGGASAPQNGQNGSAAQQGYGQNGFEAQGGDRFPLHRRRRRHRAARGDAPGGDGEDAPRQNGSGE
jgi:Domain of unknown function (DUF4167)